MWPRLGDRDVFSFRPLGSCLAPFPEMEPAATGMPGDTPQDELTAWSRARLGLAPCSKPTSVCVARREYRDSLRRPPWFRESVKAAEGAWTPDLDRPGACLAGAAYEGGLDPGGTAERGGFSEGLPGIVASWKVVVETQASPLQAAGREVNRPALNTI